MMALKHKRPRSIHDMLGEFQITCQGIAFQKGYTHSRWKRKESRSSTVRVCVYKDTHPSILLNSFIYPISLFAVAFLRLKEMYNKYGDFGEMSYILFVSFLNRNTWKWSPQTNKCWPESRGNGGLKKKKRSCTNSHWGVKAIEEIWSGPTWRHRKEKKDNFFFYKYK